ncbi:MAG: hypothetical protein GX673_11845 [Gammaproteobacteria bacterium]|nr:hypothetical protein [Gammaproteobacteria bacterium]
MLTISAQSLVLASATVLYLVGVGGWLLKRSANKNDARLSQPFITMLQVALISGVVFSLASVPSYVARIVNSDVLPFIMPYTPVLFVVSFVVFLNKLESSRSGKYQAGVALWLAASVTAALMIAQIVQRALM